MCPQCAPTQVRFDAQVSFRQRKITISTAESMPNTPSMIVYSLGGLRDDSEMFRQYFGRGDFPEWPEIRALLDPA